MENESTNDTSKLLLQNNFLTVALVVAIVAIPVVAIEFYKVGFMQGGIEVIKFAQKAAETTVK